MTKSNTTTTNNNKFNNNNTNKYHKNKIITTTTSLIISAITHLTYKLDKTQLNKGTYQVKHQERRRVARTTKTSGGLKGDAAGHPWERAKARVLCLCVEIK